VTALEVIGKLLGCLVVFLTVPLLVGQLEHKAMAHMQSRLGPMYAGGFHGWAQLVADGVKFVQKESVVPARADRRVFELAPLVALLPYLFVLVTIPVAPGHSAHTLSVGVFFALAVVSVGVIGVLMAGWASANKYSLLGGLRAGAQLMAYELPLVLAAASVAMAAGTLSLDGIAHAWHWWWLPYQGVGLVVFFVAALAELRRPPFDMPVADCSSSPSMRASSCSRRSQRCSSWVAGKVHFSRTGSAGSGSSSRRSRCRSWSSGCASAIRGCGRINCRSSRGSSLSPCRSARSR
jgi:NADH-quinone oxidoreductase subunit H